MSNFSLKIDDATDFIERALSDFLRDKKLQLTDQQYTKLKKLLMVRLMDEEMSYASAYNQLSELVEYRKDYEINANAPDEAEEEMIRIIGAADSQEIEAPVVVERFKKRFFVAVTLLVVILAGLLVFQGASYLKNRTAKITAVITTAEEEQLKNLVSQVVELEKMQGNNITSAYVYNQIKKLDRVKAYGAVSSYKKFNHAQHRAAIEYLNEWMQKYKF